MLPIYVDHRTGSKSKSCCGICLQYHLVSDGVLPGADHNDTTVSTAVSCSIFLSCCLLQSFAAPIDDTLLPDVLPEGYQAPFTLVIESQHLLVHPEYTVRYSRLKFFMPLWLLCMITDHAEKKQYRWVSPVAVIGITITCRFSDTHKCSIHCSCTGRPRRFLKPRIVSLIFFWLLGNFAMLGTIARMALRHW